MAEHLRKVGIEQAGIMRSGAVMKQAADHLDAERLQLREARVGPGKVAAVGVAWRDTLPEDGIANGPDAQARDQVDVPGAKAMAGLDELVAPAVADARNRAFRSGPELQRSGLGHWLAPVDRERIDKDPDEHEDGKDLDDEVYHHPRPTMGTGSRSGEKSVYNTGL